MTIPIVPGPFSFLAEAGGALGEFAKAKQHNRELARQGIDTLSNLVQLGILPAETITSKEAQHLFQVAGIPPQATIAPQPKQKAAAITAGELDRVQPGSAAARAVSQVPSEEVAGAGEQATVAQAGSVTAKAKADTSHSMLQENITTGAMRWLGDNPAARDLSYEAAVGLLPLRIARLQSERVNLSLERQANHDEVNIYLHALDNVGNFYRNAYTKWQEDLTQATRDASLNGQIQADNPEQVAAFQAAFSRNRPEPQFDQIRDQYLKTQMGMDSAEFQRRLRAAMDRSSETPGKVKVRASIGSKGGESSSAYPTNRPGGQRTRVDLAINYLRQYIRIHGSFDEAVAHNIEESIAAGKITSVEARSVLARLGLLDEENMNPVVEGLLSRIGER